ncbi:MAG TPA: hypothetical protein ENK84_02285 [Desulfobulbus sp.]|nr:hypothetical protein [Desulfobulbus sp.]
MKKNIIILIMTLLLPLLNGCGGREFSYVDNRETQPGPGLISGKSGGIAILGNAKEEKQDSTIKDTNKKAKQSPTATN